jgi:hypothetical protein
MTDLPFNSRYRGIEQRVAVSPAGEETVFLGRRIIPDRARYVPLDRHRTLEGDRIDQVAAGAYGDPLLYWRICDANGDDDTLAACLPVGRLLIVPQPLEIASHG